MVTLFLCIDWDFSVDCCYYALLNSILSWTHANGIIVHKINSHGYLWYHAKQLSDIKKKEQDIDITVGYRIILYYLYQTMIYVVKLCM